MGYSGYGGGGITTAHAHSTAAGDGGALTMATTSRVTGSFLATEMALT